MAPAVDEEGRRARDAAEVGRVDVLGDPRRARVLAQVVARTARRRGPARRRSAIRSCAGSSSWCSSSRSCISQNVSCARRPRPPRRRAGRAGGRRSAAGAATRSAGRRVGQQLADDRLGLAAVRALEVAVLDQRDRGVVGPRMWSRSGSTGTARSTIGSAVPSSARARSGRGEQRGDPEHQPGEQRGARARRDRTPSLASASCAPWKARVAISSETVKPIAGDGAGAEHRGPADRRPEPAAAQPGRRSQDGRDADRLADHVADQDAERDRRGERLGQEAAVDRDAGVGQREQRHDHVARPRVVESAAAARWARSRGQADAGRAGQLRRRLLAEQPEQVAGPLQVAARGRVGVR